MTKKYAEVVSCNIEQECLGGVSMTIPQLSTTMSSNQLQNTVATAVLGKQLDTMNSQGASLINMMDRSMLETSVNPNVGSHIDLTV